MPTIVSPLKQFSDGSNPGEVGTPRWFDPAVSTQNNKDTVKYATIELEPDGTVLTALEYRTGGFPLSEAEGGGEMVVSPLDPLAKDEDYKFSCYVARQLNFSTAQGNCMHIASVEIDGLHIHDPDGTPTNISDVMYDRATDRVRIFLAATGVEVATGAVIRNEADDPKLRLVVGWI